MKFNNKYICLLIIISTFISCKKFVDITPSPLLIAREAVFTDEKTTLAAVSGVYAAMRAGTTLYSNGGLTVFTALSSDEIYNPSLTDSYKVFYENNIPNNDGTVSSQFWINPYKIIYRANAIIEGVEASSAYPDSIRQQFIGEMKVVRALTYFYLTNIFGKVPLVTTTDYVINEKMGRTDTMTVYNKIIKDLKEAEAQLKKAYPSIGKLRPNKFTAAALLARVYLYQKDWANAENEASLVINSQQYQVMGELQNVFLINSVETIWEIGERGITGFISNSAEAGHFIPGSATQVPVFALSKSLETAFEVNDKRKMIWVGVNKIGTINYHYPYKFKNRGTSTLTEYNIVLRLAEQYLIRAEARARQGNTTDAVKDINVVRIRAGLTGLPETLSQAECLAAIEQERRIELFAEWGHRWLDLKRTGRVNTVMSQEKSSWKPFAAYYPIPVAQLLYNINLTQNDGYPQ